MKFTYVQETKRFFVSVAQYVMVVVGGTVFVLIGSQFIGYLPYSDRPGPGWIGAFPVRSISEVIGVIGFAFSFGTWCVVPATIYGSIIVAIARFLEWLKVRRWIVGTSCGLLAGFVSQFVIGGVGWLIAIGWVPVIGAAILGVLYGAWLLPRRQNQPAPAV